MLQRMNLDRTINQVMIIKLDLEAMEEISILCTHDEKSFMI